ncbi:MAG: hypothetical protein K6B15_08500 [Parasporobacterium sp.]|nr:hypothetical protein [Parasporobacterium sp.]
MFGKIKEKFFGTKKKTIVSSIVLAAIAAAVVIFIVIENSFVYHTCRVEAGVTVTVDDFLKRADAEAYITDDSDEIDTSVPGEYNVKIKTGLFKHRSKLIVEDTIAPEVTVRDAKTGFGKEISADKLVVSILDATKTEVEFKEKPDFSVCGDKDVTIVVTDLGGNVTEQKAKLTVWPVESTLEVEAGSAVPSVEQFVLDTSISGAQFITDMSTINMNTVCEYPIDIQYGDQIYTSTLSVIDTVAPVIQMKNVESFTHVTRQGTDFIAAYDDATELTYTFETEPDILYEGTQNVVVIATDEGGNQVKGEASLTLQADTEAPVIYGAEDMVLYIGETISYRSVVTASDNCMEQFSFVIDSSNVNPSVAGVYPVYCTATDATGNTTTAAFNVTVMRRAFSEADAYGMAAGALSGIISEGMSKADICNQIFWYIRGHMSYRDWSEKGNWAQAAGEAFYYGRGDCYNYASMAKAMLTVAGIDNMDIQMIPYGNECHFWSIVDVGDGHGWYHFDTTPRVDGVIIFLWTDAELTEYSNTHGGFHNYDRSLYPPIP